MRFSNYVCVTRDQNYVSGWLPDWFRLWSWMKKISCSVYIQLTSNRLKSDYEIWQFHHQHGVSFNANLSNQNSLVSRFVLLNEDYLTNFCNKELVILAHLRKHAPIRVEKTNGTCVVVARNRARNCGFLRQNEVQLSIFHHKFWSSISDRFHALKYN